MVIGVRFPCRSQMIRHARPSEDPDPELARGSRAKGPHDGPDRALDTRPAELIPGTRLVVISGRPHNTHANHAEAFNRALLGFLAD